MIPSALIQACERNAFVWHRQFPKQVERAFDTLSLEKRGEFFDFAARYCLQFSSKTLPFEFVDFVDEDGQVSDIVDYAHDELGISSDLIPISSYEAEAIYCVRPSNDKVVLLTSREDGLSWDEQNLSDSFFVFIQSHL